MTTSTTQCHEPRTPISGDDEWQPMCTTCRGNRNRPATTREAEYHLTYMGEVLDTFDTFSGAAIARDRLWADVLANRLPNFLDADDVERDKGSAYHFPIREVPAESVTA